ncbi:VWA domain-containing protein [Cytophagales bacterium LB-30]|uniref:VWA domain-containing protein n=1 Tax=Shiella aurantiaca TaxID=3058365 RepID=A0ABT8F5C8_9BACT|nr:VWA domain-containing protein [Shiella aurantiaca]MDN4165459.1 VWA domain-containing protein [Shiella aurantiaca]
MTWFNSLEFPDYGLLILLLAGYGIFVVRLVRANRKLNNPSAPSLLLKGLLRATALLLLVLSILGPSMGSSTQEIQSVGKDIYLAVDLSESMNASDVSPSRLEKVKFELKNIIKAFNSDRIGLIIFSAEAFVQCPLTYDQAALSLFIETLNTELISGGGTEFGPALRIASEKLLKKEELAVSEKSKVIVLISDGEDFGTNTEEVADEIRQSGIRLFMLGVGTEKGSTIPSRRGNKRDRNGQEVISKLQPESLQQLAQKADGEYFQISDKENETTALIQSISQIEGELREVRKIDVAANKYQWFLAAALILFFLDTLISVKTLSI